MRSRILSRPIARRAIHYGRSGGGGRESPHMGSMILTGNILVSSGFDGEACSAGFASVQIAVRARRCLQEMAGVASVVVRAET